MPGHQLEQHQTAQERKNKRAKKSFPGFFCADVRAHQMPTERTARQIRAHVAELRHRDQIQNVKLAGHDAIGRARRKIKDLGDEIEQPEHVKQTE